MTIHTLGTVGLSGADTARVQWLRSTLAAVQAITRDLKQVDGRVPTLLAELDCTLTEIVGGVTAMTLLTEVGDPTLQDRSLARWRAAAPVAVSSD